MISANTVSPHQTLQRCTVTVFYDGSETQAKAFRKKYPVSP